MERLCFMVQELLEVPDWVCDPGPGPGVAWPYSEAQRGADRVRNFQDLVLKLGVRLPDRLVTISVHGELCTCRGLPRVVHRDWHEPVRKIREPRISV